MKKILCEKLAFLFLLLPLHFICPDAALAQSSHIQADDLNKAHISVDFDKIPLTEALQEIGRKCTRGITYTDADLAGANPVTLKAANISVAEALNRLLAKTQFAYKTYKDNIVVYVVPTSPPRQPTGGMIRGTLSGGDNKESLVGANIIIVGTSKGVSTDAEGHYQFVNVPEGICQLAFSYIGYETAVIRDIRVKTGDTITVDCLLKPSSTQLMDIDVIGNKSLSGNVVETNDLALINSIKTSSLIITGISAQQISRSADQDAGEVARRLPGVTMLNNFVNIRGMHERYNVTFINGMIAPTSESDRRAFSYDLLPSNMIDKMTVFRSPGPELPADWAGGVIKIETKNSAIARQIEVTFSSCYRPGSSFHDYYSTSGKKGDWMMKNDGSRVLQAGFPGIGDIPAGGFGSGGRKPSDYTAEELVANARLAKQLYNNRSLQIKHSGPDYKGGINYYDSWQIGDMRLSNLTSGSTSFSTRITNQLLHPMKEVTETGVRDVRVWQDTISQRSVRWTLLENLALQINSRHRIEANGLFNRLATEEALLRNGIDIMSELNGEPVTKILSAYRSRTIFSGQLAGNHYLDERMRNQLKWLASYSYSREEAPAHTGVTFTKTQLIPAEQDQYTPNNGLYYIDSSEKNPTFALDYEYKVPSGLFFRMGVFHEYKDKNYNSRLITIGYVPQISQSPTPFNINDFFEDSIYREDGTGAYIYDNQYLSGQYAITGKIYAGYGSVNVPLFNNKLNIYGGLRYEGQDLLLQVPTSNQTYIAYLRSRGLSSGKIIDRYRYNLLPSVNISLNFNKNLLARVAYGKTINRPNFRELIPIYISDLKLDVSMYGNDTLKDATIDNFDMRMEYYPSGEEFISVGAFYKKLSNAIEPYTTTAGYRDVICYDNTPKATIYGLEAELRKSFGFLQVNWLRSLSTIANLTFLHSEVKFRDGLLPSKDNNYDDFRIATRPLEGTAKYVINLGLYYDQKDWGTKISTLYNVLGQRLVYSGTLHFPETYELPGHVIDLTLRQRIGKHIELRAGVQDLLNQSRRLYRDWDRNKIWDPGHYNKLPFRDWMYQQYKPGSYYTLGFNLTL